MYATYEQYTTYLSGKTPKVDSTEFTYFSNKASIIMDTFSGLKNATVLPDEVISCCCEIVELLKTTENRQGISSENNDGYSVSYDTAIPVKSMAYSIMNDYLANTGLLYRGCSIC